MRSGFGLGWLAAGTVLFAASSASAQSEIHWWHAMTGGNNDVNLCGDEFSNERWKPFIVSVRPAVFDGDIAAFLVTMLAQAFTECVDEIGFERRGGIAHEANAGNFGLRA